MFVSGTVILLIIAVVICIISIIKNKLGVVGPESGAVMGLGASMLIATVVVILGIFIAYFNGVFNSFKTSQDRMTFKYDEMMHYPPVKPINSISPASKASVGQSTMDKLHELMPLLKTHVTEAIKAITKDTATKARVERALSNVALNNDTRILADYDFSLPAIKLAVYLQEREKLAKQYKDEITQVFVKAIEDLKIDRQKYVYTVDIPGGTRSSLLSEQVDILGVINIYSYFAVAHSKLAKTCVERNGCPFSLNRSADMVASSPAPR